MEERGWRYEHESGASGSYGRAVRGSTRWRVLVVLALAAGAGSRSSSASSAGHRVSRKTLKDRQGKPLAIKDSQGRTLVPMNAVQRRSKDVEMDKGVTQNCDFAFVCLSQLFEVVLGRLPWEYVWICVILL